MDRRTFLFGAPLALTACGAPSVWAPDEVINRVRYTHPGPKYLTLLTMRNTGSDNGAHTALIINASERVIFDPAGSFGHESIPERNDVVFGVTPGIEQFYISYHSRITFYTQIQYLEVPADVAEQALILAKSNGPVAKSLCTTATSRLLGQLPGFESIRTTIFPGNLADQFARLPGVIESTHFEDDDDDKEIARDAYVPEG